MRRLLGLTILLALALAQSGAQLYQQNCAFCHGEAGQGRVGAYPPLAQHAPELLKSAEGRAHLLRVMLYGMQGPVRVRGQTYDGVMPAFPQLSDEQIASVLNHILVAWGNDRLLPQDHRPFTAAEVAALRASGTRLSPQQVGEARARIRTP
ncbi:MAG: cytochrome c [Meiothermus sp.]|uniref:c-type cytochrome n=1 Tax=Meiothermus sp. TaxID=1955249 RepID=UPI0025CCD0A0|nr:cytochrome c [Meiothermus sp.]MCS7194728.1 cytochrome c [Meiothermus sp.]MCX7739477.1 cytochrome c [Meiothermus sp.]